MATDIDPGFARDEALVTETLFARARELWSNDPLGGETVRLSMLKEDPHVPVEAVYVLDGPPNPSRSTYYRVVHARAKEPLTGALRSPGAHIWETFIEERTFRALERAWGPMARGARWPHGQEARKLPTFAATEYTFEYAGTEGYGQGEVSNPELGSCTARLAWLGELLIRLADEPDQAKRGALETQIRSQSQLLAERLEGWE